ncbi:hypothetical protein PG999_009991 [Apiospora kogelbergensis]|uniref:Uncharacterized protein n=1 Tax=Apiospora kogelbergensis TaxID=1337665 RepID=A0AAW0QKP0_9PEZI
MVITSSLRNIIRSFISWLSQLRRTLPVNFAGTFASAGVLGLRSFDLQSKLLILLPCVSSGIWVLWHCSYNVGLNFESTKPQSWFRALVILQVLCLVSWAAWPASWQLVLLIVFLVHCLLALAAQRIASDNIDWAVCWLRLRQRVAASRKFQESIYSVDDVVRGPRALHTDVAVPREPRTDPYKICIDVNDAVALHKPRTDTYKIYIDVLGTQMHKQDILQRLTGKVPSQLWQSPVQKHYVLVPESSALLIIEAVNEDTRRTKPHLCVTACDTPPSEETHRTSGGKTTQWRVEDNLPDVTADGEVLHAVQYVRKSLAAPGSEKSSEVALSTSCI